MKHTFGCVCRHWEYLGTCMLTKAVLLGSQTTCRNDSAELPSSAVAGGEGRHHEPAANSALRGKKENVHLVGGAASSTFVWGGGGSASTPACL